MLTLDHEFYRWKEVLRVQLLRVYLFHRRLEISRCEQSNTKLFNSYTWYRKIKHKKTQHLPLVHMHLSGTYSFLSFKWHVCTQIMSCVTNAFCCQTYVQVERIGFTNIYTKNTLSPVVNLTKYQTVNKFINNKNLIIWYTSQNKKTCISYIPTKQFKHIHISRTEYTFYIGYLISALQ